LTDTSLYIYIFCQLAFNCDVGTHVLSIRSESQLEIIHVTTFQASVPLHSNLCPQ